MFQKGASSRRLLFGAGSGPDHLDSLRKSNGAPTRIIECCEHEAMNQLFGELCPEMATYRKQRGRLHCYSNSSLSHIVLRLKFHAEVCNAGWEETGKKELLL
jgi:hypothetical protein